MRRERKPRNVQSLSSGSDKQQSSTRKRRTPKAVDTEKPKRKYCKRSVSNGGDKSFDVENNFDDNTTRTENSSTRQMFSEAEAIYIEDDEIVGENGDTDDSSPTSNIILNVSNGSSKSLTLSETKSSTAATKVVVKRNRKKKSLCPTEIENLAAATTKIKRSRSLSSGTGSKSNGDNKDTIIDEIIDSVVGRTKKQNANNSISTNTTNENQNVKSKKLKS